MIRYSQSKLDIPGPKFLNHDYGNIPKVQSVENINIDGNPVINRGFGSDGNIMHHFLSSTNNNRREKGDRDKENDQNTQKSQKVRKIRKSLRDIQTTLTDCSIFSNL